MPARPLLWSPLQSQSYAEERVLGDRSHVLMLLANISLAPSPNGSPPPAPAGGRRRLLAAPNDTSSARPIRVGAAQSWLGPSPDDVGAAGGGRPTQEGSVTLDCGNVVGAVELTGSAGDNMLAIKQLGLAGLPQGPRVAAATSAPRTRGVPLEMLALGLWCFKRCACGLGWFTSARGPSWRCALAHTAACCCVRGHRWWDGLCVGQRAHTQARLVAHSPPLACRPPSHSPMGMRALSLDGVALRLPRPEYDYLAGAARSVPDFVVELVGEGVRECVCTPGMAGRGLGLSMGGTGCRKGWAGVVAG